MTIHAGARVRAPIAAESALAGYITRKCLWAKTHGDEEGLWRLSKAKWR